MQRRCILVCLKASDLMRRRVSVPLMFLHSNSRLLWGFVFGLAILSTSPFRLHFRQVIRKAMGMFHQSVSLTIPWVQPLLEETLQWLAFSPILCRCSHLTAVCRRWWWCWTRLRWTRAECGRRRGAGTTRICSHVASPQRTSLPTASLLTNSSPSPSATDSTWALVSCLPKVVSKKYYFVKAEIVSKVFKGNYLTKLRAIDWYKTLREGREAEDCY